MVVLGNVGGGGNAALESSTDIDRAFNPGESQAAFNQAQNPRFLTSTGGEASFVRFSTSASVSVSG